MLKVVAFPFGSTFSAFGASTTDVVHRYGYTLLGSCDGSQIVDEIGTASTLLMDRAFRDMRGEGFEPHVVTFETSFLVKANGVPLMVPGPIASSSSVASRQAIAGKVREVLDNFAGKASFENFWLTASAPISHWRPPSLEMSPQDESRAVKGHRPVFWGEETGFQTTPIYASDRMSHGVQFAGPAIVESPDTACAVPPGWNLVVDELGFLEIRLNEGAVR
jgi:N-methylhydantoinase A/oxoprolinase/acetone carboxylase beta subunit